MRSQRLRIRRLVLSALMPLLVAILGGFDAAAADCMDELRVTPRTDEVVAGQKTVVRVQIFRCARACSGGCSACRDETYKPKIVDRGRLLLVLDAGTPMERHEVIAVLRRSEMSEGPVRVTINVPDDAAGKAASLRYEFVADDHWKYLGDQQLDILPRR